MDIQSLAQSNILKLLGFDEAPKEEQETLLRSITAMLLEDVVSRIKDELSVEAREQFFALFADGPGSNEERLQFLKTHVPNLEEMILEETLTFKYAVQKLTEDAG